MKTFTFAAALLISASMPAAAETWQKSCQSLSETAADIMEARQSGVSMAKLMDIGSDLHSDHLWNKVIIDAFEQPHFSTPDYQNRALQKFRDRWYLYCAKVMTQ